MRNIEQAAREGYALRTFDSLERALEWPSGLIGKILVGSATDEDLQTWTGREPAATPPGSPEADDEPARRVGRSVLDAATQEYIERLVAEAPPLTPEQRALVLRVFGRGR